MSMPRLASVRARLFLCVLAAVFLTLAFGGCGKKPKDGESTEEWCHGGEEYPDAEPDADGYITDPRDGKRYRTVKIGGLAWMAENLNYEGDNSWCYDESDVNCAQYGRLYKETVGCPPGWRMPSVSDWDNLFVAAGGSYDAESRRWNGAGAKLKSKTGWKDKGSGTDALGFSAMPGGFHECGSGCVYKFAGEGGYWWAHDEGKNGNYRAMGWDMSHVNENRFSDGGYWLSVRCVRGDADPPAPGAGRRPVPPAPEINASVSVGTPDTRWYRRGAKTITISTADQLAGLAELVNGGNNFAGATITLGNDIDLSAYGKGSAFNDGKGWIPIGINYVVGGSPDKLFCGRLDGGGKKIRGLYINDPKLEFAGIFGCITGGAAVENIGVENVNIAGGNNVGGIVGYIYGDNTRVSGCWSSGAINGIDNVGGVVGDAGSGSRLSDSYSTAAVTGDMYIGGVTGSVYHGVVSGCYSTGAVRGSADVGGVAGIAYGELSGCYSTGAVSGRAGRVGGVVGRLHGSVSSSYSTGAVSGREGTGGVAGSIIYGSLSNCAALNPSVKGAGESTGRVVGYVHNAGSDNIQHNAAFAGLKDKDGKTGKWTDKGENAMDGADIAAEEIIAEVAKRLDAAGDIWTTEEGKLPGLGGKAVEMPGHLR